MKYKHIVFDIDGTLIDTEYAVLHSLQETIKELSGRKIPCSELRFALGITGTDALKKLEIKDTSYAIELWDKNMRNYTNTIKVFDGIIELLKNLLSLDYEMGIVTSKTRDEFTHDFCPFGISHYFKTIICADDTQEHKPNAAPILKYVELSKTDHSKVLYIGDSKYDSKCAENTGIETSSVTRSVPGYYKCTGSDVNIRSGPGTQYTIVGTLNYGTKVYVYSISNGWAKISLGGIYRYVSADYLREL